MPIVSASSEATLVWDSKHYSTLSTIKQNNPTEGIVLLRQDQPLLYFLQEKALIHAYDGKSPVISPLPEKMTCLASSHSSFFKGKLVLVGSESGRIYAWEVCNGKLLASADIHFKAVKSISISSDDAIVWTGGEDGVLNGWSLAK